MQANAQKQYQEHILIIYLPPGNVHSLPNWLTWSLVYETSSTVTNGPVEWFWTSVSIADTGPTLESSTLFTLKIWHGMNIHR